MMAEGELRDLTQAYALLGRILRTHEMHTTRIAAEEAEAKAVLVAERTQREIEADTGDN